MLLIEIIMSLELLQPHVPLHVKMMDDVLEQISVNVNLVGKV